MAGHRQDGRSPTGWVPVSSSASLWLSTKSAFSAGAAAVCADPLTSTPYLSELELSWLGNREGELATTNGTPELGADKSNGSSAPGSTAGNSDNVPSGRKEDRSDGEGAGVDESECGDESLRFTGPWANSPPESSYGVPR